MTATIHRVRTTDPLGDPLAARMRLERILASTQLCPPGLAADATLCVRSVRDPLPGALQLVQAHEERGTAHWRQSVASMLDDLARHAARPVHGAVPASAQAILFLERAELLACLAHDWLCGDLLTHWWWRSLLAKQFAAFASLRVIVVGQWLEEIAVVPAALHLLQQRREATHFARQLTVAEAETLQQHVVHRFGLRHLHTALAATWAGAPATPAGPPTPVTPGHGGAPPWQRWLAEPDGANLPPAQQTLLGLALTLVQAPQVARSARFAQDVAQWQLDLAASGAAPGAASPSPAPGAPQPAVAGQGPSQFPIRTEASASLAAPAALPANTAGEAGTASVEQGRPLEPMALPAKVDATGGSAAAAPPADDSRARRDPDYSGNAVEPAPSQVQSVGASPQPPTASVAPVEMPGPIAPAADGESIDSACAGVFYLINLGIYLGLYADFSAPLEPEIDLNLYDFLALVGEQLAGATLHANPVWALLARLAGRTEDEESDGSFTLRHAKLIEAILPPLRERLCLALGETDPAAAGSLLCQQPGQVKVTGARIDLYFSLAAHPIQLRLCGLDRDPGWVPAAGRYVAFHYD